MLAYTTFRDTTDEIRQIHRFFDIFRQILQILCRNQARSKSGAEQKLSTSSLRNSQIKERVVEHVD